MDELKLSILICNTQSRVKKYLPVIVDDLCKQAEGKEVEILWLGDNKQRTVGEKRNALMSISKGEYFSFVDDDDRVSPNYVDDILREIRHRPDVVVFQAFRSHNGKQDRVVHYDINYVKDENLTQRYQRLPNHLMAWNEKYKSVKFIKSNFGEDADWAQRVKAKGVTSQRKINRVLYYYDFQSNNTETQNFI